MFFYSKTSTNPRAWRWGDAHYNICDISATQIRSAGMVIFFQLTSENVAIHWLLLLHHAINLT